MRFQTVNQSDFQAIVNLVASPEELYLFYPTATYPLDHAQLEAIANTRTNLTSVRLDNEIVGFADIYDIKPEHSAFIGNVIVSPSVRGKGVGFALMSKMMEICRDKYRAVPNLSVFNFNTNALLLYSRMGFIPYAVEPRKYLDGSEVAMIHMQHISPTTA